MTPVFLGAALLFLAAPAPTPAQAAGPNIVERAAEARRKGDLGTARRLYEEALRQDPENGPVALALGETLTDLGELRAAEGLLSRLVRSLPDRPEPRRALAMAYLRGGKPREALVEAQKAVELDPKDSRSVHGLALAYAAVDDPRTEETFQKALALAPRSIGIRFDLVTYFWQQHRYDRGNEEMERVLKAAPSNARLRARYGESLFEQGRFTPAVSELERAWKDGARDYEVACLLGAALGETGRFADGEKRLRDAAAMAPEQLTAHHALGRLLFLDQKPEEAAAELLRASALQPDSAAIRLELGRAEEAAGKLDRAEASYRETLKLDPSLAKAHYSLGTLLARAGRRDEARPHIEAYQAAFQKEQEAMFAGGSRRAELNLGWIELERGQPEKALAQFERHPENADALRGAARALIQLGRFAEAVQKYERAVALAPDDLALRHELDAQYDRLRKK